MGQSTDAILAYGFKLGDDEETLAEIFGITDEDEAAEFGFEEFVLKLANVRFPKNGNEKEYELYNKAKGIALAACPVDVITHCSAEYPMYFLALRGWSRKASRGYPERLATSALVDPPTDLLDAMLSFCEKHKLIWRDPAWHLFSYWG